MAQGYTRNDTSNNISTGNIINATDLDGEFDALQGAFDATAGHNHDGSVGGGAPISTLGPTQEVVVTTTAIRPSADNTLDLGTSLLEFKDLYIDGVANIDSLVADTADINGGTIDNTTIATSNITVGAGKTIDVSAGTLTLADNQISGDKVEGGTIAATTITTLTSTTVNATTVDTTNLEVTTLKAKDGTTAGTVANTTGVVTLTSLVATTADINGGTIDGATIGASVPAAITGTTITANSSLGGTLSTAAQPNVTSVGTLTSLSVSGDLTIADKIVHSGDTDTSIRFPAADTITMQTNGVERFKITDTGLVAIGAIPVVSPNLGLEVPIPSTANNRSIGVTSPTYLTDFKATYLNYRGSAATGTSFGLSNADLGSLVFQNTSAGLVGTNGGTPLVFATNSLERMRITPTGNVGIGTSSPSARIDLTGGTVAGLPSARFAVNAGGGTVQNYSGLNVYFNLSDGFAETTMSYGNTANSYLAFGHHNGTSYTERMRIDGSGNVGIGTTSSVLRLNIAGDATWSSGVRFTNTTNTSGFDVTLGPDNDGTAYILNRSANAMIFGTSNVERMRITGAGNVGIGTSSPSNFAGYTTVSVNNATNGGIYNILVGGTETARLQAFSGVFSVAAKGASTVLTFETNSAERMRIHASGGVSIGNTTDPGATNLSVTGSISTTGLNLGGVAVTSSAAELNVLDGIPATLTATELGYVDGVTSAIQTQLDAKAPLASPTFSGTVRTNAILDAAGGNTATINGITPALATQAEAEAGTDNTKLMTPLRTDQAVLAQFNVTGSAPTYACRAWVNFNGTGTVAIRASGNVSSITDNGTGTYTINFTTAMPDANYAVIGSSSRGVTDTNGTFSFPLSGTYSTTAVQVRTQLYQATASDNAIVNVAIFR